MGLPVVVVATGGLPVVESTTGGTPVTEAANGYGIAVTKVVGKPGMPVVFETIGVTPPIVLPSFDPATALETTLSNGNLTATHVAPGTANTGARCLPAASSGKYYFEITRPSSSSSDGIGLITTAGTYGNVLAGLNCTSVFSASGNISSNGGASGKNIGGLTPPVVVGVAVDLIARKAWFRKGAGLWNGLAIGSENPATGLGGVIVAATVSFQPVVVFGAGAGGVYTLNFGATAYANAAPAGFGNWPAGLAPAAPVLDLLTDETDTTPDFTLTGDLVLNDTVRFQYSTSAVFSGASELTNAIDAAEDAANTISFTTGALAATTWYFRARIERPDHANSNWSNTETVTIVTSSYDAATTAWVNAVVAAGGTVSTTQKDRVDALIVGLKADGLFSVNSRLWIHAGESVAKQATIDIMGLGVCTLTVAPTLGASGYTGNGTSQYIDYGGPPSDFVQDSCSFGAYNTLSSTTINNDCIIGWFDNVYGTLCDMIPLQSGSGAISRVHQVGGSLSGGNTNRKGMFLSTRRASTDAELYYNGSSVATSANASQTTLAPRNLYGLARNDVSAIVGYGVDVIAVAWIGPGLSDTQAGNLSARINTYMTSWGINVY